MILDAYGRPVEVEPIPYENVNPFEQRMLRGGRLMREIDEALRAAGEPPMLWGHRDDEDDPE